MSIGPATRHKPQPARDDVLDGIEEELRGCAAVVLASHIPDDLDIGDEREVIRAITPFLRGARSTAELVEEVIEEVRLNRAQKKGE
jgi:hypothetical protein